MDVRFLGITLAVFALVGIAAYFVQRIQVRRHADVLLTEADDMVSQGDFVGAAEHLFRYLQLRPDDANARVQLAEVFDRVATDGNMKRRARDLYTQALGVAPEDKQSPMRRRVAELSCDLGEFNAAADAAHEILQREKDNPHGWRLLATARYGLHRLKTLKEKPETVGDAAERANQLAADNVEMAIMLAAVYRSEPELLPAKQQELKLTAEDRAKRANQIMDRLVAATPKVSKVYLARYAYRTRYQLPQAREDLVAALQYGPDDPDALFAAAEDEVKDAVDVQGKQTATVKPSGPAVPEAARKHYEAALNYYEHVQKVAPKTTRASLEASQVCLRLGRVQEAERVLREGLKNAEPESAGSYLLNTNLAGLLIDERKLDEAQQVLDKLDSRLESVRTQLTPAQRDSWQEDNDLLRARWLAAKGNALRAIPLARRAALGSKVSREEVLRNYKAWVLLGELYGAIKQWDQAATALDQAADLQPNNAVLQKAMGDAWSEAYRPDMAIKSYEKALALSDTFETRLALAQAQLRQQVALPQPVRDWASFEKILTDLKTSAGSFASPEAWRLALLEVEYLLVRDDEQGRKGESARVATELLRAAEQKCPQARDLPSKFALAYERLGMPAEADRLLTVARKQIEKDNPVRVVLLEARLAALRKHFAEASKILQAALEKVPGDSRPLLQRELVQLSIAEGRAGDAAREFKAVEGVPETQLELACQLAEAALDAGQIADAQHWETRIREIEGDDGCSWRYYQARRLMAQGGGSNDAQGKQITELVAEIRRQRPAWPAGRSVEAALFEARGKTNLAIEAYQDAIRLGEQRPAVYGSLIALLTLADRSDDADRYLTMLRDRAAAPDSLSSLEMVVAAGSGKMERALEIARKSVQRRGNDSVAYLQLGQMAGAAGHNDEAEKALKKAVELAPDDVRSLGALFAFYARTGQTAAAQQTLDAVAKRTKLSDAVKAGISAQGYDLLGDRDKAKAAYEQMAKLVPDDLDVQRRWADFLLRGGSAAEAKQAEDLLRQLLVKAPQFAPARRMLAELLVERGGEAQWREAQQLLSASGEGAQTPSDRRLQAMLLVRRGGLENRNQAKQIFTELMLDRNTVSPTDRQWLARIHEADGNIEQARRQYAALAAREPPREQQVAAYVDFLLRHGSATEADAQLNRLEKSQAADLTTVGLRARWLQSQQREGEIEAIVEPLATKLLSQGGKDETRESQVCQEVCGIYLRAKQYAAAERWARRLLKVAPERHEMLAVTLVKQHRVREAVDLCIKAAKTGTSARPALFLTEVLVSEGVPAEELKQADTFLAQSLQAHSDDVSLQLSAANFRAAEARWDDAVSLYRQALARDPRNVVAMNNLATLLGEQASTRQEAQQTVDRALEIAGPQSMLQDTKGTILVSEGKLNDAITCLEGAVAVAQPDPRHFLHLAMAYDRAGKGEKARAALASAEGGDLARQVLTVDDRKLLSELKNKYKL